jgi:hypothetical protein
LKHINTSSIYSHPLLEGTPPKRLMAVGYPKKDLMDLGRNIHRVIKELGEEKNRAEWLMRANIVAYDPTFRREWTHIDSFLPTKTISS